MEPSESWHARFSFTCAVHHTCLPLLFPIAFFSKQLGKEMPEKGRSLVSIICYFGLFWIVVFIVWMPGARVVVVVWRIVKVKCVESRGWCWGSLAAFPSR